MKRKVATLPTLIEDKGLYRFISANGRRAAVVDQGYAGCWRVFLHQEGRQGYAGGGGAFDCCLKDSEREAVAAAKDFALRGGK